jgi:hypothetical protein
MCKLYDGNGLICKLLYLIGDTAIINVSPSLFAQSHFTILKITSIVAAKIMPNLGYDQTKSVKFLLYNVDYSNNGTNFFKQRVHFSNNGYNVEQLEQLFLFFGHPRSFFQTTGTTFSIKELLFGLFIVVHVV